MTSTQSVYITYCHHFCGIRYEILCSQLNFFALVNFIFFKQILTSNNHSKWNYSKFFTKYNAEEYFQDSFRITRPFSLTKIEMNPKFTLSSDLYIVCHQKLLITLVTLCRTAKLCRLPLLRATNSHHKTFHKKCDTCSFWTKYTVCFEAFVQQTRWIFWRFSEGERDGG